MAVVKKQMEEAEDSIRRGAAARTEGAWEGELQKLKEKLEQEDEAVWEAKNAVWKKCGEIRRAVRGS